MPRQPALFPSPPRVVPVKRMHVNDAGNFPDGSRAAQFRCDRCGAKSEWQRIASVSEAKRGIPCLTCNQAR